MDRPGELTIELLSDATFGRGEGTAGEVDVEVEHDSRGLPFLGGKTLHGLLRDTWLTMRHAFPELRAPAERLLGVEGDLEDAAILRIGDARLPAEVEDWFEYAVRRADHPLRPGEVLRAFTDVRRQTAEERSTGAPARTTLRSSRVVLRGITLHARLDWMTEQSPGEELQCLALCALGTRYAGLVRNRGRGHLRIVLNGDWGLTARLAQEGVR